MIAGFKHRGLKRLYERGDRSGIGADLVDTVETILSVLDAATTPQALNLPRYHLHPLKGDRREFWAVTVRANWRIIFRFSAGDAYDVELIDYHQRNHPMPMKSPVHPGRVVRQDCLEPLHLSVTAASKALGVTRQALNNLVNEQAAVSPEMAVRLSKAFGGTAEAWLTMQSAFDLAQIRKQAGKIRVKRVRAA